MTELQRGESSASGQGSSRGLGFLLGFAFRGLIFSALVYQTWPSFEMALSHREAEATVVHLRCGSPNVTYYDFEVDEVTYHGTAENKKVCGEFPLQSKLGVNYVTDDPTVNIPAASGSPEDLLGGRLFVDSLFLLVLFPSILRVFKFLKYE